MTASALITMLAVQLLVTLTATLFMIKVLRKKNPPEKGQSNLRTM